MEGSPGQKIESKDYERFIPLDKYWIIRMGVLDLQHGFRDINKFLSEQKDLGGDLAALKRVCEAWDKKDEPFNVGESGTIYRIVRFILWKQGSNREIKTEGSLTKRINDGLVTQDPNIVNNSLDELARLDKGTTQWVTAAILTGSKDKLSVSKFFNDMTYEAMDHWQKQRDKNEVWIPRKDVVLTRQAEYFLALLNGKSAVFVSTNPDDYCFARAFDLITKEEGEEKFPEAEGHESNRFDEMEKVITQTQAGEEIDSGDHRVVQAMAMWGKVNKKELRFTEDARQAVNKSWPLFWEFLEEVTKK